jgi:hypothetical protein
VHDVITQKITNAVLRSPSVILRYSLDDARRVTTVGIATRYGLDGPGIEFWWGRDLPYQPWGTSSLLYNGYLMLFPRVKPPGRGVDHPTLI